jgi:hypothetical protein
LREKEREGKREREREREREIGRYMDRELIISKTPTRQQMHK